MKFFYPHSLAKIKKTISGINLKLYMNTQIKNLHPNTSFLRKEKKPWSVYTFFKYLQRTNEKIKKQPRHGLAFIEI